MNVIRRNFVEAVPDKKKRRKKIKEWVKSCHNPSPSTPQAVAAVNQSATATRKQRNKIVVAVHIPYGYAVILIAGNMLKGNIFSHKLKA